MTEPVTPPAPILPEPFPALGDPNFNQLAYDNGTSMPAVVERVGEMAVATRTNAVSGKESAQAAQQSAVAATNAAASAVGAANFKGIWAALSGPLNKPACVKHEGRFWMLLNNLADVAASEPGVTADWTSLDAGSISEEVTSAGTVNMVVGVLYVIKVAGVTLVAPATLQTGDRLAAMDASGIGFSVDWGAFTVKGQTPESPMLVSALRGFSVVYSGGTLA